jgi:hypothetical protein
MQKEYLHTKDIFIILLSKAKMTLTTGNQSEKKESFADVEIAPPK